MLKFSLKISLQQKKRGQLSKNGHIYHNDKAYVKFKTDFAAMLAGMGVSAAKVGVFTGIIFSFSYVRKRGHLPDVENTQGAVQDAMVSAGVIPDDDRSVIPRYAAFSQDAHEESVTIFICHTWEEYTQTFLKLCRDSEVCPQMRSVIRK
jgi:Holliday junction resolvase RusA-like endonuclease